MYQYTSSSNLIYRKCLDQCHYKRFFPLCGLILVSYKAKTNKMKINNHTNISILKQCQYL